MEDSDTPDLSAGGWQKRYENQETGWDRGEPSPALLSWLESGELQRSRVLVPGCGRGHEVVELANRGYDVTAIDFAPTATKALGDRLRDLGLSASVLQESVLDLDSDASFDVIYEQTCLCALHPKHWEEYERELHTSLKQDGRLLALFMQSHQSGGPPFHCGLPAMRELFSDQRWIWSAEQITIDHPAGMQEIAVILSKLDP
ncbi:MAG: methyltransferase domain-containing protein [Aureliella sp.]